MSISRNSNIVRYLEQLGYQQLFQTPLPDPGLLRAIKANPKLIDESKGDNGVLYDSLNNMRKHSENFDRDFEELIILSEKLQNLQKNSLQAIPPTTRPKPINLMSQRLFLKDGELYYANHKDLLEFEKKIMEAKEKNESYPISFVPEKVDVMRGVFAIVLAGDAKNGYTLEHRVSSIITGTPLSGHLSLVDTLEGSVISAGEEFIADGKHLLCSNQTGGLFKLLKEYNLTAADQRALLNICFHGLAGSFYEMKLKAGVTDGSLDEDAYTAVLKTAGADQQCKPVKRFNFDVKPVKSHESSPAAIMAGLQITTPSPVSNTTPTQNVESSNISTPSLTQSQVSTTPASTLSPDNNNNSPGHTKNTSG